MRYLLLVFLFVGCVKATVSDGVFDRIYEVPNKPKDQIYSATKVWIAENFRSAKAVIEHDDINEGTLIGNGVVPCSDTGMRSEWKVQFRIRVDVKDNKFKLTFTINGGQLKYKEDIDRVKIKLLSLGDELVNEINKSKSKKDF